MFLILLCLLYRECGYFCVDGNKFVNGKPTLSVHCFYQMSILNHKRTTRSLAPPIFCVAKNWQLKGRGLPIKIRQKFQEGIYSSARNLIFANRYFRSQIISVRAHPPLFKCRILDCKINIFFLWRKYSNNSLLWKVA